jgi:hypothetical protein
LHHQRLRIGVVQDQTFGVLNQAWSLLVAWLVETLLV